jgi:CHAT domain-containing protein/tetratricopeptide (TPR) repeat protein
MAGGWLARRLAAVAVRALVCGCVFAGAAYAQGQDDLDQLLAEVGRLYGQGKSAEAAPIAERAVALARERHGEEHAKFGSALGWLAIVYQGQGRFADAEPLHKRSLAIREKALGPDHPNVGAALHNLAVLYREQGRHADAEPLMRRGLAIAEKEHGPEHPVVGTVLDQLAEVLRAQRRYAEAEPLYRRSIAIGEKSLGQEHPSVGKVLNGLAELYLAQGRYAAAEPLLRRNLNIFEKALGHEHPDVGTALTSLARLDLAQGRRAEAELLLRRSLDIYEKALGPEHPHVRSVLNNLAALAYIQSDWATAATFWRRSTGIIKRRAERGLADGRGASGGEAQRLAWQFRSLVRAAHRLAVQGGGLAATPAVEMFETAQWALNSEAAASLAQMAARSAKGSPQLAGLVRERQDLVSEWQAKDKQLIATKSEPSAKREADAEKALADRLTAIDTRLVEIDRRLARDFPDYTGLASPAPVSVAELQTQLGVDEALVLFLDTPEWKPVPEETFIWVVTKTNTRWARSALGTTALTREVAALRCGLDATAWYDEGAERCAKALGIAVDKGPLPNQALHFDHARAHRLYLALFGEVESLITGKHLLVVPSGPLTQLPFQVLVTKAPSSSDHRSAAWLAREHAVTVLPAVSSLKALRRTGRPSAAPRPMIGFGNPLLDGPDASYTDSAQLAREKQRCPETRLQQVAARRGGLRVEMRGGLADVLQVREQVPLPETADELCAVAQDVKAVVARDVYLGAQATERDIKRLSASGELAKYRMVHFATHGSLAGQLSGTHEPGLILTPPDKATEEDDGYLSASEIASLKLDADWVILSACNTAAGAATNAEALSGLARAFIYAQARALLVSHWEVYSDATVKLITAAIREMARDPKVGRSEAMRRSMLALIDKGEPHEAHPAFWAPFVVVGEGGARR